MRHLLPFYLLICCSFCLADNLAEGLSDEQVLEDLLAGKSDRLLLSTLKPKESLYHLAEGKSIPPISHKNKLSKNALWAHPVAKKSRGSFYVFSTPKNAKSLRGIAVVRQGRIRSQSPLTFKILDGNGDLLWSTGDKPLRKGGDGMFFDVPVKPEELIHLEVHGNRAYGQSHAAWFEPQFVLDKTRGPPLIADNSVEVDVNGEQPIVRPMADVSLTGIGAKLGKDAGGSSITFSSNGYFANAYELSGEYLLDRFRGHRVVPEGSFNRALAEFSKKKFPESILEFNLREKVFNFGTSQYRLGKKIAVRFDAERAAFDIANKDRYASTGYLPSDIFAIRRKSEAWGERRADPLGLSWGSSPDTNSVFTRVPKIIYCEEVSDLIPLDAVVVDKIPSFLQQLFETFVKKCRVYHVYLESKLVAVGVFVQDFKKKDEESVKKWLEMSDKLITTSGLTSDYRSSGKYTTKDQDLIFKVIAGYENSTTTCNMFLSKFSFVDLRYRDAIEEIGTAKRKREFSGKQQNSQQNSSGMSGGMF